MPYDRLEPSHPEYAPPGFIFFTLYSPSLGGRGNVLVYLPPQAQGRQDLPVAMLLHGVFGSHHAWAFQGGAHLRLQQMVDKGKLQPMVLVMPDDGLLGEGSGYLAHPGRDCERWIVEDVVDLIFGEIPGVTRASAIFLAGFSMGGCAALRLGAKYRQRFAAISAHAPAARYNIDRRRLPAGQPDPEYLSQEQVEAIYWLRKNAEMLPPTRFEVGHDDFLLKDARWLHETMSAENIPHQYEEVDGAHTWDYVHHGFERTLRFFALNMPCY